MDKDKETPVYYAKQLKALNIFCLNVKKNLLIWKQVGLFLSIDMKWKHFGFIFEKK